LLIIRLHGNAVTAVIVFFAARVALLVGVTTPEKIYFGEVHDVPAARQMLEPVMPAQMLNPMHPPRARQLMARSIRTFGDAPLGWRYPSVLERVRLIQVMPAMKIRDILDKP
jgi:dolichyl-phosphate-mannose-protein mannosyltransferase